MHYLWIAAVTFLRYIGNSYLLLHEQLQFQHNKQYLILSNNSSNLTYTLATAKKNEAFNSQILVDLRNPIDALKKCSS